MSFESKERSELNSLNELEFELGKLLFQIKPSDKLEVGDKFTVEKDVLLPDYEIVSGSIINVTDIEKSDSGRKYISFDVIGSDIGEHKMSQWIFVCSFCTEVKIKEEEFLAKINKIKDKINKLKELSKEDKVYKNSEEVRKEVGFLLGLTKKAKELFGINK